MTKYRVLISETAIKQLNSLNSKIRERLKSGIKELESSPFLSRPKADIKKLHKLTKHDLYRLRIGDYRVVYGVENNDIKIIKIFIRGKGYEWLD